MKNKRDLNAVKNKLCAHLCCGGEETVISDKGNTASRKFLRQELAPYGQGSA